MWLIFILAWALEPRAKLKTASGTKLTDCCQSRLISRGGYTPSEPINSSSEKELKKKKRGQKRQKRKSREKKPELKVPREREKLTFSYFSEALENYFSKFRVLIP